MAKGGLQSWKLNIPQFHSLQTDLFGTSSFARERYLNSLPGMITRGTSKISSQQLKLKNQPSRLYLCKTNRNRYKRHNATNVLFYKKNWLSPMRLSGCRVQEFDLRANIGLPKPPQTNSVALGCSWYWHNFKSAMFNMFVNLNLPTVVWRILGYLALVFWQGNKKK